MNIIKKLLPEQINEEDHLFNNLQQLLHRAGINEAELSRQTNIPTSTIHKIFSGKTTDPRISTLKTLADYFDVDLGDLYSNNILERHKPIPQGHSLPVISWEDCIKSPNPIAHLTVNNWEQWIVIDQVNNTAIYGLPSKPSMEPRFPRGTILIVNPEIKPIDGDLVIVKFANATEAALRELTIDGPNKLLMPINQNGSIDKFDGTSKIIGTVIQTRFTFRD
ncbi:MAG: helix-turn-helix domain-containing protein [Legionellales bacterium]|nr:helix-turn-helix domain-containing protein [Legionellales bacterium]